MGVYNDCLVIYGIEYTHDEASVVAQHEDYKETVLICYGANEESTMGLWGEEFYYEKGDQEPLFIASSPHYDARYSDCSYFIGVNLTGKPLEFIKTLDTNTIDNKIKKICSKYKLDSNKEIKMHYTVDVN